ncbi:MAG: translesion DNA synthesis-associated protein ImuA [Acidobacteriota bacterium]|nr:translesion DNA synthesis-associated protein ImuA [Acidobacteriota bacterium]
MNAVLDHPDLWRARRLVRPENSSSRSGHPTGFPELDAVLHDGGWPSAGLAEVLCDTPGVGELRLLLPALARLSRSDARWIAWVAPPFTPYAPALAGSGIDLERVLLIHPRDRREALWATEQALGSGASSAVLAWLDESGLGLTGIRRLQLAAKQGRAWANLFRPAIASARPSMAELRVLIEDEPSERCDRVGLTVLKRRGGWATSRLVLEFGQYPVRYELAALEQRFAFWRGASPGLVQAPAGIRVGAGVEE